MKSGQLTSREEYNLTMKKIEGFLQKVTELGGFDKLSKEDANQLAVLSNLAEQYEDSIPLMPIKQPSTLAEMIRFKMFEKNLKQKQLAVMLETSEANISGVLTGKRKLTFDLAKKLHTHLGIDAHFLLTIA
ncbi:MAG TPA: helix-turn-helix domain-containing protein [Fluviicola sp.]|nr:helix-turn-helix domain-containing protein [Fluviicola sp.]